MNYLTISNGQTFHARIEKEVCGCGMNQFRNVNMFKVHYLLTPAYNRLFKELQSLFNLMCQVKCPKLPVIYLILNGNVQLFFLCSTPLRLIDYVKFTLAKLKPLENHEQNT